MQNKYERDFTRDVLNIDHFGTWVGLLYLANGGIIQNNLIQDLAEASKLFAGLLECD